MKLAIQNISVLHKDFLNCFFFNKDGPDQDAGLQVQINSFFVESLLYLRWWFYIDLHQKGSEDFVDEYAFCLNEVSKERSFMYVHLMLLRCRPL